MFRYRVIDDGVRLLSSLVYRVVLITVGIIICLTYDNIYPLQYYFVLTCAYAIAVYLIYKNYHDKSYIRLALDFVFMLAVLYKKPVIDILLLSFLYIPIVNAPNFSGRKRNISIYILTLACLTYLAGNSEVAKITIAVFAFAIIGFLENTRTSISRLAEDVFESIDESYVENLNIGKTHRVYREIIREISGSRFAGSFPIEDIYCLTMDGGRFRIVNTSKYVYNIKFENKDKFIKEISKNDTIKNVCVEIDDNTNNNNICIMINQEQINYIFIVTFSGNCNAFLMPYLVNSVLKMALARVANILEIEWKVRGLQREYFDKLSKNIDYFESAADTMHFLNNKFSPLKAFITMSERLDKIPAERRGRYIVNMIATRERAKKSLNTIIERAENLLEIKNNLLFRSLDKCSISKLFSLVRKTWYEHFESDEFEPKWARDDFDKNVLINEEGFYYVITNIMDNMSKHNNGIYDVKFYKEDDKFVISFINNFSGDGTRLKVLASEFMSDEILEIEMRKRSGLGIIKKILKQMPVDYDIQVGDKEFVFKLIFMEVNDENINI